MVFRIDARPNRIATWGLSWFLFAAGIALYLNTARTRHIDNPEDKVAPSLAQMARGFADAVLKPDDDAAADPDNTNPSVVTRVFHSMLWTDTVASAKRFAWAMLLLVPAVVLGLHMGLFPVIGTFFLRFILFFDKIIALSVLPILFIAFGIDELSKIMLIVIGVTPTIILDSLNLSKGVPREQIVKGFTLGAGNFDIAYLVMLKQIFPRVLNSIRINLKSVALFLFAGEMIASDDGLAYRIALLRRHMAMDTIIPYVLWVALLLFLIDQAMRLANRWLHPWFRES